MNSTGIARRDDATAEWFDALDEDRLLLRTCPAGHWSRPDVLACDICRGNELSWQESAGAGHLVSLAVDHSAATTVAIVELDEGPWLVTRFDGALEDARANRGDAVTVRFMHPSDGESYPVVIAANGF
jgi:uncharacterized OB-fold protein